MRISLSDSSTELIRGRKDDTPDFGPAERRLDSLARLLASHSICVAVAIIDGTLCVTANELYASSKNNAIKKAIEAILRYFARVAEGKIILFVPAGGKDKTVKEREDIFLKQICISQRLTHLVGRGGVVISDDLAGEIARKVLYEKEEPNESMHDFVTSQKEAAPAACVVYGNLSIEILTR